jgi:fatty-acyl-CoA synthase
MRLCPHVLGYPSGASAAPLPANTIGANFDAAVSRYGERAAPADRPAVRRRTCAELAADVDAVALGLVSISPAYRVRELKVVLKQPGERAARARSGCPQDR